MSNTYRTINQFMGTRGLDEHTIGQIKGSESFKEIRSKIASFVTFSLPESFYDLLIKQLDDLLDIRFSGLIANGWRTHRRLKKYLDRSKYPPPNVYSEVVSKHTLTSTHRPSVRPVINGYAFSPIEFEVALQLVFESAALKIRDARIVRIETGSCLGKGAIKYKGFAVLTAKTQPVPLPGSKELDPPIAIES